MAGLFGDMAPSVSLADQMAEVEREIRMRRHVYAGRVADGKMTKAAADRQTGIMEAVLATLQSVKQAERG
jgi:hypothetical protein